MLRFVRSYRPEIANKMKKISLRFLAGVITVTLAVVGNLQLMLIPSEELHDLRDRIARISGG